MARTLAQQLDAVDTAIAAIESGAQSISHDGKTYGRAQLSTLYAERKRLTDLVAQGDITNRTRAEF